MTNESTIQQEALKKTDADHYDKARINGVWHGVSNHFNDWYEVDIFYKYLAADSESTHKKCVVWIKNHNIEHDIIQRCHFAFKNRDDALLFLMVWG